MATGGADLVWGKLKGLPGEGALYLALTVKGRIPWPSKLLSSPSPYTAFPHLSQAGPGPPEVTLELAHGLLGPVQLPQGPGRQALYPGLFPLETGRELSGR